MTAQMPAAETVEQEWWVQRWIDLLNTYRFKKRLERGRIYAREGNILHMDFRNGKVHAKVQGTASEPYKLTISIERFSNEDWDFVINSMAQKAIYSAKLLAGTMPDDIEEVFTSNGLSLFPFALSDVRSRCNCPDPKNPCKHIAAVYYQLGDFFREDPFVLFQLRGRTKAQILEAVRQRRSGITPEPSVLDAADTVESDAVESNAVEPDTTDAIALKSDASSDASDSSSPASSSDTTPTEPSDEAIATDADESSADLVAEPFGDDTIPSESPLEMETIDLTAPNFWQYDEPLDPSLVVITPPGSAQTVLDVLGKMPLAPNDAQTVRQYLDTVYQSVSQQAMITALSRNG